MNSLSSSSSSGFFSDSAQALSSELAPADVSTESSLASRLLFEALQEAVLLLENEYISYGNSAASRLFNAEQQPLVGSSLSAWLPCKEYSELYQYLRSSHEGSVRLRGRINRSEDQVVRVDMQCFPIRSTPGRYMLFLREGEQDEADLNSHENADNQAAVDTEIRASSAPPDYLCLGRLPCGVMRVDKNLRYLYGNTAMSRWAPFLSAAEIGCKLESLRWPAAFRASLQAAVACLIEDPRVLRVELSCSDSPDGPQLWAEALPECDAKGKLVSVTFLSMGMPSDDPHQQETERSSSQLLIERQRREEAVAASQARDTFFSWVSHEMRTPMNGIQSWAHILETYVNASSASPLARRALQGIRHGIAQQVQLMDELLDVGRIIEGRLALAQQAFVLRPTMQAAMESVQASALSRQIHLACQYSLARERVKADPCRVEQTMRLLLIYLLSRSPKGSTIHLHAQRMGEQIVVRLHSARQVDTVCGESTAENDARGAHEDQWRRRELDIFLARRLTALQGGLLEYQRGDKNALPCFTLRLPLHTSGKRRASSA